MHSGKTSLQYDFAAARFADWRAGVEKAIAGSGRDADLRQAIADGVSVPALGTAIEGTRFGNPDDPKDVRTLGEFKTGLVRVAMRTGTPIVPIVTIGTDRMLTNLEEVYKGEGTLRAFQELQRLRANRQPVQVRVLPLYTTHLSPEAEAEAGAPRRPRTRAEWHTQRLREQMVAEILALDPAFPAVARPQEPWGSGGSQYRQGV